MFCHISSWFRSVNDVLVHHDTFCSFSSLFRSCFPFFLSFVFSILFVNLDFFSFSVLLWFRRVSRCLRWLIGHRDALFLFLSASFSCVLLFFSAICFSFRLCLCFLYFFPFVFFLVFLLPFFRLFFFIRSLCFIFLSVWFYFLFFFVFFPINFKRTKKRKQQRCSFILFTSFSSISLLDSCILSSRFSLRPNRVIGLMS
jgi:hypothetical protein